MYHLWKAFWRLQQNIVLLRLISELLILLTVGAQRFYYEQCNRAAGENAQSAFRRRSLNAQ